MRYRKVYCWGCEWRLDTSYEYVWRWVRLLLQAPTHRQSLLSVSALMIGHELDWPRSTYARAISAQWYPPPLSSASSAATAVSRFIRVRVRLNPSLLVALVTKNFYTFNFPVLCFYDFFPNNSNMWITNQERLFYSNVLLFRRKKVWQIRLLQWRNLALVIRLSFWPFRSSAALSRRHEPLLYLHSK